MTTIVVVLIIEKPELLTNPVCLYWHKILKLTHHKRRYKSSKEILVFTLSVQLVGFAFLGPTNCFASKVCGHTKEDPVRGRMWPIEKRLGVFSGKQFVASTTLPDSEQIS